VTACILNLLLALSILTGAAAAAQSRPTLCGQAARHIELKPDPIGAAPEVCISVGLVTVLSFDTDLARESVTLEGRERFAQVDLGDNTLKLVPSEKILPGERLRLTVRFKDGAAPGSVAFWLVVHPARAEPLVEVSRQRRTVESYQQEAADKDIWLRRCQEETARLHAEKEGSGELAALLDAGLVDNQGVAFKDLALTAAYGPGSALRLIHAYSYRSSRRVIVDLWIKAAGEAQPWTAVGAELVGPGDNTLRVLALRQQEPILFGGPGQRILIEVEATEEEAQGTFTLKLWDTDRSRSILLSGVSFPQLEAVTFSSVPSSY
jgi:uncharacterized protein (TIGR02268 family)